MAALTAFFGLPFIVFNGFGAFDAFLKIEGVPGESVDDKHKDWIEVLSFSWGVSNQPSVGGGGTRKVTVQDFQFTKSIDKASPLLMLRCCTGKHIPTAVITVRKTLPTGGDHIYLKFEMEDLLVSSWQVSGSRNDAIPTDSLSLNFSKITMTYIPETAGQPGEPVSATYDVRSGAAQ